MLNEKLKSKKYYFDKLSLFIRNSYGIKEQVELFWKTLIDIDSSIDDIFLALKMINTDDIDDTLDKLAEIIGVKRNLDVIYIEDNVTKSSTLNLTNIELLRFIKTRILQNNYTGSFVDIDINYANLGLVVIAYDDIDTAGIVHKVLNLHDTLTNNDKKMFMAGLYSIRSVGIHYEYSIQNIALLGVWDDINFKYDSSEWGA